MKKVGKLCRSLMLIFVCISIFTVGVFAATGVSYSVSGDVHYDVPARITSNVGGGGHNI